MDQTDIALCMLLLQNARLTFRELGDSIGLSVNAVHKRINILYEAGIVRRFTAHIRQEALGASRVLVFGTCEAKPVDEIMDRLGSEDRTYWVSVSNNDYFFVGGYLRDINELEPFVASISQLAQMKAPKIGIESPTGINCPAFENLDALDLKIVRYLQKNSRAPHSEIANELGVATKTVKRHLGQMIEEDMLEITIDWYPDTQGDLTTIVNLDLKPGTNKEEADALLRKLLAPHYLFSFRFSNIPNFLSGVIWTNTMKELMDVRRKLRDSGVVEKFDVNIMYDGRIYDTWRDRVIIDRIEELESN